jgi:hypothetical protein
MAVELLDTERFHGFRVRRQIAGKTYQEYFSLKQDGKRIKGPQRATVKALAEARDAELAKLQKAARERADRTVRVDARGQVRGILCRLKTEKSGTLTPVFQIGVMSRLDHKIVNTTVSISRYGETDAWRRAVDFYALHKGISKRSRAYRDLLAAQPSGAKIKSLLKASGRAAPRRSGRR